MRSLDRQSKRTTSVHAQSGGPSAILPSMASVMTRHLPGTGASGGGSDASPSADASAGRLRVLS
jgi:hypothetical protein